MNSLRRGRDMKKTFICLIVLGLCLSCGVDPDSRIQKELGEYFAAQFLESEPGGAILVMKGEKVLYEEGFGIADMETAEKITPDTVFNTGSISKTFVANGILILEQEGRLSLDESIDTYFQDFKNSQLAQEIKIHHFLSHTSGITDSRKVREERTFFLTANDEENFFPITQNETSNFPPGAQFEYSNPAYNGLALIIERISGQKWQEFIERNIFDPAGMPNSKITDGAFPDSDVAHGYIKEDDKFKENDYGEVPTFCAAGNGGVWSSVRELAKYELALRNAVFLDKEAIDESRTVFKPENWDSEQPPGIGYSWFISELDGLKVASHTGSQGGFRADFVSIPEKELLYLVLCNTPKNTRAFRERVLSLWTDYGFLR